MHRWLWVSVVALCGCGPGVVTSWFESTDEGWTLSGNWTFSGDGQVAPELIGTGGNPAGAICGVDTSPEGEWFFSAPAKFLGDQRAQYGRRVTFDLKQDLAVNLKFRTEVVLVGHGKLVSKTFTFAPGQRWTLFSVRLDDQSGWEYQPPSEAGDVKAEDLEAVLSELEVLRIRGEYSGEPDARTCLDNVYLGRP